MSVLDISQHLETLRTKHIQVTSSPEAIQELVDCPDIQMVTFTKSKTIQIERKQENNEQPHGVLTLMQCGADVIMNIECEQEWYIYINGYPFFSKDAVIPMCALPFAEMLIIVLADPGQQHVDIKFDCGVIRLKDRHAVMQADTIETPTFACMDSVALPLLSEDSD